MKTFTSTVAGTLRMVLLLFAITFLSAASVYAQQGGGGMGGNKATPEDRAKRQTEMMKDGLNLTAAQEPKVSAINLKYAKKMEEVRKIADTAAQRKSVQNLNKQKDGELKTVLTADQFKAYLKQVEEMKARRRNMQR
jgi:Spy/CpxP family protein refolding chaperone